MVNLIPKPEKINIKDGYLRSKRLRIVNNCDDERISKALSCFKNESDGVELVVKCNNSLSEAYTIDVAEDCIVIDGEGVRGAFYGIQTLKQLMLQDEIPCMTITDRPDMEYRGVYQDVTRGKVPTVERLKKFIDTLSGYKINSLQLYVEHTFPFKEFGDSVEKTGYLSPEEIKELDDYCYDRFIDFIPSIATFGHMYELLERKEFNDLCVANKTEDWLFWWNRMIHHTIDPVKSESIEIVKSLIDQYVSLFRSDTFNICCDETFDLKEGKHKGSDTGKLYIDFVKKIIAHVEKKGKKVMMWGDILLEHPECIDELPADIELLNWWYGENPNEKTFETFEKSGKSQIVCPGTSTWSRLVEGAEIADKNIVKMIDYGYKHNARGVLNTNWGDFGNPCALELAMHGLVLGAGKSWNVSTEPDDEFKRDMDFLEYRKDGASEYIYKLDRAQSHIIWNDLAFCYSNMINSDKHDVKYPQQTDISDAIKLCTQVIEDISDEVWEKENYREELLLAAKGIIVMAELFAVHAGYSIKRASDTRIWLKEYRKKWLESNKESELIEIEKMFMTLEEA